MHGRTRQTGLRTRLNIRCDSASRAQCITQTAWVLPADAQDESTGTLAKYLKKLGVTVEEYNLDSSDEDGSDDENASGFIDDEAEEQDDEDEK